MFDTWLIVWTGLDNWQATVEAAVAAASPAANDARHVVFSEADGPRRGLLLVNWATHERDVVVAALKPGWEAGWVNSVSDLAIHDLAKAFDSVAEIYERTRPLYPEAAIARIVTSTGLTPGGTVVDLGAGTGKFTRLLKGSGAEIIGVEPVAGMREVFTSQLPGVAIVDGTAESMPLPAGCADVVTAAQAFHWFDAGPALEEIARVLKPGGHLALIWNVRNESTSPFAEISPILDRYAGSGPRYRSGEHRWRAAIDASPHFGPVSETTFPYSQVLSIDDAVDRFAGVSYVAALSERDRRAALDEIRDVVSSGGGPTVTFYYDTQLYLTKLFPKQGR